jgi:hypothetical protein
LPANLPVSNELPLIVKSLPFHSTQEARLPVKPQEIAADNSRDPAARIAFTAVYPLRIEHLMIQHHVRRIIFPAFIASWDG